MHAALDRERAKLELRAARLLTHIDDDLGAVDRQAGVLLLEVTILLLINCSGRWFSLLS